MPPGLIPRLSSPLPLACNGLAPLRLRCGGLMPEGSMPEALRSSCSSAASGDESDESVSQEVILR